MATAIGDGQLPLLLAISDNGSPMRSHSTREFLAGVAIAQPSRTCYGDLGATIVIRIDASLVESHSDKECAAGNFEGGYGFHPLTAWCDNTGALLAVIACSGNAGSNTAADHIAIIDAAIAAVPARWRRNLLISIDGAGSSHAVVKHLTALNARPGWSVQYSVGFDLDERVRKDAQVAEVTGLLRHSSGGDRLDTWPDGMRILVRREEIETGAQLSLFEQVNGYRCQPLATAAAGGQAQRLEARHRVHARAEGFIRCGKATGLAKWPSGSFAINTAWITAAAIAIDLLCWTRLLLLDGALAKAEPATLRYRLLHAAARLISHARMGDPADLRNITLGTRFRRRVQPRRRDPLTAVTLPQQPRKEYDQRERGTRRHRTTCGAAAYPLTPESRSKRPLRARHGPTRPTVKFRGR